MLQINNLMSKNHTIPQRVFYGNLRKTAIKLLLYCGLLVQTQIPNQHPSLSYQWGLVIDRRLIVMTSSRCLDSWGLQTVLSMVVINLRENLHPPVSFIQLRICSS